MNFRVLTELAAFQAVWLTCALGAADGRSAPGIAAAALFVAAQLRSRGKPRQIAAVTLVGGSIGLAMETFLITSELVRHSADWPDSRLAPAWIVALWLAFASTMPTTARLLGSHPLAKAAILGAVFGPLAYAAGAQLGALRLSEPQWIGIVALACSWAVVFPGLVTLARTTRATE